MCAHHMWHTQLMVSEKDLSETGLCMVLSGGLKLPSFPNLLNLAVQLTKAFSAMLQSAKADRRKYAAKLEGATGDDVFKYLFLLNFSELHQYISQTRLQAQQSFVLSVVTSVIGFVLVASGVILGIVSNFVGGVTISTAYLSAISGILTEFISGVFFYLYSTTLRQLNLFHAKMVESENVSVSLLANSLISEAAKKDEGMLQLSTALMKSAFAAEKEISNTSRTETPTSPTPAPKDVPTAASESKQTARPANSDK